VPFLTVEMSVICLLPIYWWGSVISAFFNLVIPLLWRSYLLLQSYLQQHKLFATVKLFVLYDCAHKTVFKATKVESDLKK
jgi:hypothetical protein